MFWSAISYSIHIFILINRSQRILDLLNFELTTWILNPPPVLATTLALWCQTHGTVSSKTRTISKTLEHLFWWSESCRYLFRSVGDITKFLTSCRLLAVNNSLLQLDANAVGLFQDVANKAHNGLTNHVFHLVDMLDCIVEFLGPELDSLAFHLSNLGKRHTLYGVKATELSKMTQSFMLALKTTLGDKFTAHDEESWNQVFQFTLATMKQGILD